MADYLRWLEQEPFKELGAEEQHQAENAALLLQRSAAQVSKDSRLVLGLAGTLAFASIAVEPITALLEDDERRGRAAVNELVNYGLLERRGERLHIGHALIHTYARMELALSKEALRRVAAYYIVWCRTQSEAGLDGYARLDDERVHCLRLIAACLDSDLCQEVKGLVEAISIYLDRQGWWAEWQTALKVNLTAARQTGDRKYEGWCLNSLGYTCRRRGENDKALDWYKQSLSLHHELGDRQGEGVTLNNIGEICREQGKYEQALNYYEQDLGVCREGGNRIGEGGCLNNMAVLAYNQDNFKQALQYLEQCLPIQQEIGDKKGEGHTLNNIGAIYRDQGDLARALEYRKQSLVIRQEVGDRAGETVSCWNIGATYKNLDDLAKAEEYISLAVQIAEAIGHPALEQFREGLEQVRATRRA